jgi:excisionase family DNA binding protein
MNLYTVSEVAELLKVSPKTVRTYLISGKLEGFKIGDKWRVTEIALQKFMQPKGENL